jgi:hypothetical protein
MRKPKNYYLVVEVVKTRTVTIGASVKADLEMSWADGMVGVCPIFTNKKAAKSYSKGSQIVTLAPVAED